MDRPAMLMAQSSPGIASRPVGLRGKQKAQDTKARQQEISRPQPPQLKRKLQGIAWPLERFTATEQREIKNIRGKQKEQKLDMKRRQHNKERSQQQHEIYWLRGDNEYTYGCRHCPGQRWTRNYFARLCRQVTCLHGAPQDGDARATRRRYGDQAAGYRV